MPLSLAQLEEIRSECFADDLAVPPDAESWTREEAEAFFESGGQVRPAAPTSTGNGSTSTTSTHESPRVTALTAVPPSAPPPPPLPPPVAGVYRWLVDISAWDPGDAEWELLLSAIPEAEAAKVKRFVQFPDKKRALVSRLLQRRVCHEATGLAYERVAIERTKGGKPYMANKPAGLSTPLHADAPNFNFNVSHEGRFVVLATEPWLVCGVDVAAPEVARGGKRRDIEETLRMMRSQLTPNELAVIDRARPDAARMDALFRRFWSLKEVPGADGTR